MMIARWTRCLLLFAVFAACFVSSVFAAEDLPTPAEEDAYLRSPRLGIAHIGTPGDANHPERYENALALGAGWNRFPIYWNMIETAPEVFEWEMFDTLVQNDLSFGLQTNAILLGRPDFYAEGDRITGIYEPVFADGTDLPGTNKAIHPDNPWARFVHETVLRYRPGGVLAQQNGWTAEQGVRLWEIWNEPDYTPFWSASIADYARLLKVAYLVIEQADPDAQVMFGGLLFSGNDNWLARVLAIYINDPLHEEYNWFMDAVAIHNYGYPWRSGWLTLWTRQTLIAYKISKPIWMNESGVPVWDDYPGPVWAEEIPEQREQRATAEQQADFFIQSSAYAWSEGADVIFFHQLYDDCGNQPAGTNFPPHNGRLCRMGRTCAGDAYGLYRNPADSICYSQHPEPGTPRPAAAAFQLVAEVFGDAVLSNANVQRVGSRATVIRFDDLEANERIYVLWNHTLNAPIQLDIPAFGPEATLRTYSSHMVVRPNPNEHYRVSLPPARGDDFPTLEERDVTAIGGRTFILIQQLDMDKMPLPGHEPEIKIVQ